MQGKSTKVRFGFDMWMTMCNFAVRTRYRMAKDTLDRKSVV